MIEGGGRFILGTGSLWTCVPENKNADPTFSSCPAYFSGKLSDVNLWEGAMAEEDMVRFTTCQWSDGGDYQPRDAEGGTALRRLISWEEESWETINVRY